jgi:hypothetical protein
MVSVSGPAHAITYDINATGSLGGTVTGSVTLNASGTSITGVNVTVTEPSYPAYSLSFTNPCCAVFNLGTELRIDLPGPVSTATDLNLYIVVATGQLDPTMSFYAASGTFTDYLSGTATSGVSATPLPAALPLFASGLAAAGFIGWRRKRKAATQST